MNSISTHVLDTARGKPGTGISAALHLYATDGWQEVGRGITNQDGRIPDLLSGVALTIGRYRITFETAQYVAQITKQVFFPEVVIVFDVQDAAQHYHVPLLLSPFGYSTYRGS